MHMHMLHVHVLVAVQGVRMLMAVTRRALESRLSLSLSDHYLGKEVLLNISTLRWANACWEPMWSAAHIESVQIIFKENIGTEGRGGYFDGIGIVRDIIQNHLMQAFMFLAMEPPADMSAAAILDRKVELLKAVQTLDLHTPRAAQPLAGAAVFLGQFGPSTHATQQKGYLDDDTVPPGSCCPTMAACVLAVDNERWRGVPFLLSAGKVSPSDAPLTHPLAILWLPPSAYPAVRRQGEPMRLSDALCRAAADHRTARWLAR